MMIDLFSCSIRGDYARAAAGSTQATAGNGVFGAILEASAGCRPSADSGVASAGLPVSDKTPKTDAAVVSAEELAGQAEPQEVPARSGSKAKNTPEVSKMSTTPDPARGGAADFFPVSQMPVTDGILQAPQVVPLRAAATTNMAPKPGAADTRPDQASAVGRNSTAGRSEAREMAPMGADPAQETSSVARIESTEERAFSRAPDSTVAKPADPTPSAVGATPAQAGSGRLTSAPTPDLPVITGASDLADREDARLGLRKDATMPAAQTTDQKGRSSLVSNDVQYLLHPLSPRLDPLGSPATEPADTVAKAASGTISPSVPESSSRLPLWPETVAIHLQQRAGYVTSTTTTSARPQTEDRPQATPQPPAAFNGPDTAPQTTAPPLQQRAGYAASATTTSARPQPEDRPQATPQPPAAFKDPDTAPQTTAPPLQQRAGYAASATTTSALPQTADRPQTAPIEPTRRSTNALRWVDPPPSDTARWAPLPPGTGPIPPPPQPIPFAGATPVKGHGALEAPGSRPERREGRTTLLPGDSQMATSPGPSGFVTQSESSLSTPRPAAELARDAARQIGAQVISLGKGRFELSLSPTELGKVEMMLQDSENRLTLIVNAERPETMDLIRRHIGLLELELRQMGLGNLSLQLGTGGAPDSQGRQDRAHLVSTEGKDTPSTPLLPSAASPLLAGDHLDLRL